MKYARPSLNMKRIKARLKFVKKEIQLIKARISQISSERERLKIAAEILEGFPDEEPVT